jgi:HD-like signal output (HDOD) protein
MPDAMAAPRADPEESLKKIRLPSCPVILTRLLREMRADEPDFIVVGKLISSDVRLAGEMIKTVNSPFYGLQVKVASIQQALNVIGLRNVTHLVTGLLLRDAFAAGATRRMQFYWKSTVRIALLNACLARSLVVLDRDEAYTFALFRDCGVLAMMASFERYEPLLAGADLCGTRATDVEDERHGISHAAIGYYLTRNWFLPEHMCEAVLRHHEYDQLPAGMERSSIEHIALAIAAEWLYLRKLGKPESSQWREAGAFALETLGTTEQALVEIVENVPDSESGA